MSDKEPENSEYANDARIACKYGENCYQKNPQHHTKYKHPPNKKKQQTGHVNKKIKIEAAVVETNAVGTSSDVSDSDDNDTENVNTSYEKNLKFSNQVSDSDSDAKESDIFKDVKNGNPNNEEPLNNQIKNHEASDCYNHNENKKSKIQQTRSNEDVDRGDPLILGYKKFIKEKFLVDMPQDFYQFWDYCKKTKPSNPLETFKDVGLKLVGPFDVLAGRFDNVVKSDEEYLLHWRYYRDPPELQTVLKGCDNEGYHIGYFRDSPDELPIFLVKNCCKTNGVLHQMGDNIFRATYMFLEDLKKTGDPFKRMFIKRTQEAIKKEADRIKLGPVDTSLHTKRIIEREKKVLTRTFNKIGLVVPYDRKTQVGYRELALSDKKLFGLFTNLQNALPEQRPKILSELQPVFTFANIAADEGDFGTGIELGWDIISHGVEYLNSTVSAFLTSNYRLLKREAFAKIAEAHMKNRKKDFALSII